MWSYRLLFGVQRSVGYISQTLNWAGEQAEAYNLGSTIPLFQNHIA
jgi:hypothetical protein